MCSKELMETMKLYLHSKGIEYDLDEKIGDFEYTLLSENKFVCLVRPGLHSYHILVSPVDIKVDSLNFNEISEYINRMNRTNPFAFCYIYEDLIMCAHRLNCNNITADRTLLDNCFEKINSVINLCCKGVSDIISGVGTAREIFKKYEHEVVL